MYPPIWKSKSRKIRHPSSCNRWYGKSFSLFKHNWCKTTQSFLLPYLHRAWAIFESYSHLAPSFSCLERSLISIKGRRSDQVSNSYRDNFQQCTLTHTRLRSKHLRAIFDWEQFCVPVTLKLQDSQDQKKIDFQSGSFVEYPHWWRFHQDGSVRSLQKQENLYRKYTAKMMDPKNNKNGVGYVKPGFESVRDLFYAGFRDGSRLHCAQVLVTLTHAIIFLFINSKK